MKLAHDPAHSPQCPQCGRVASERKDLSVHVRNANFGITYNNMHDRVCRVLKAVSRGVARSRRVTYPMCSEANAEELVNTSSAQMLDIVYETIHAYDARCL